MAGGTRQGTPHLKREDATLERRLSIGRLYALLQRTLGSNDVAALLQVCVLLAPVMYFPLGRELGYPYHLSPAALLLLGYGALVGVCLLGVRASRDRLGRRLIWSVALVVPGSLFAGWVILLRSDAFFTSNSLYQVSTLFLLICLASAILERPAAVGTPADVLARSSTSTACVTFFLFWALTAVKLQPAGAVSMMLGGVLLALSLIFRVPGAIVPIYRWRRRKKRWRWRGVGMKEEGRGGKDEV